MLAYVQIITPYIFKNLHILYQGNERPAQTKLMPAKLRAVLLACSFSQFWILEIFSKLFRKFNLWILQ